VFSYLSPEERVRKDHPLRAVRAMTDAILHEMSPVFDSIYARRGRPSIPPEKLLRAQLLQMRYSVRSERLLMEEIDYSMLYRWFVDALRSCERRDERFRHDQVTHPERWKYGAHG
jgi:transposase